MQSIVTSIVFNWHYFLELIDAEYTTLQDGTHEQIYFLKIYILP